MRIKKDASSWRAGGVLARDARHEKTPSEIAPHRSKKNTRRWCKGHVGREHTPVWRNYKSYGHWRMLVCTTCGKQLDHDFPPFTKTILTNLEHVRRVKS